MAIQALARSETVSGLAARHGVSRKFVYQQTHKARIALVDAFSPAAPDSEVLFELAVTKVWLRQVIVGLALICHGSHRSVVEFLRDLLGLPVSIGTVHQVLQLATRQAGHHQPAARPVRHSGGPARRGFPGRHARARWRRCPVDVLLHLGCRAASRRRHLGRAFAGRRPAGLDPDYTVADAGQGLRAGQRAAWGDTPCHGDLFHIQRQCEGLANTLARLAKGATSRRQTLQAKMGRTGQRGPDDELAAQRTLARQAETQAHEPARDIRTLTQWLRHDVLALAGPALVARQALFDFVVEELAHRGPRDLRRIHPVRVALQNQRDALLAFAGVLDGKLAAIAQTHAIAEPLVREACALHRLPTTSSAHWQGWNRLRAIMDGKFHALFGAVSQAMAETPRGSSLVENLNSRLRTCFTLRRRLGNSYLDLLRFFPNHRRLMRSRHAEHRGKSLRELMTGQGHPHWLTLLGMGPLQPQRT